MASKKLLLFSKRTLVMLSPLTLFVTLFRLSTYTGYPNIISPALSGIKSDSSFDSVKNLSLTLASRKFPKEITDFGTMLKYTPSGSEEESSIYIDQLSPFNSFSYGDDYRFRVGTISGDNAANNFTTGVKDEYLKLVKDKANNKYTFQKADFDRSPIRNKGDLNLILDFQLEIDESRNEVEPFKVPITTSIDLTDLLTATTKTIPLFEIKQDPNSDTYKSKYDLVFKKNTSGQEITLEVKKTDALNLTKEVSDGELSDEVKLLNFFVLFTENPAVNFEQLFSETDDNSLGNSYLAPKLKTRKIHLDNWNNSSDTTKAKTSDSSPKYTFDKETDFWKSFCQDPYKVGGFIDEDLKKKYDEKQKQQKQTFQKIDNSKNPFVARQKSAWIDVDSQQLREEQKQQYWWKQINNNNDSVYHPTTNFTTASPCSGIDDETKNKLKTLLQTNQDVKSSLAPSAIKDFVNGQNSEKHRKDKIIQGSFRAWGGTYAKSNEVKTNGLFNSQFEAALQTNHTFGLTIPKAVVEKSLIDHAKLAHQEGSKKLNQLEEISSMIQVIVPYSFVVYDPISNYTKKQRINLHVDLDLKSIYNQSSFRKNFYTYDLGVNHGKIGKDSSGKDYGLSGLLNFSAGLDVDVDKNIIVSLVVNTKGFVSTKNPDCDLRHRIYKINGNDSEVSSCKSADGSKYSQNEHIPPFIVVSIDRDPEVSSFYIDRRVPGSNLQLTAAQAPAAPAAAAKQENVKTLEGLKADLEKRTIKKIHNFSNADNGEVFYENINASEWYKVHKEEKDQGGNVTDYSHYLKSDSGYYWFSYWYIPRRNGGSISVDTDNLKTISLFVEGSSTLASKFFRSQHFGTLMTSCTQNQESTKATSSNEECGDGNKYEEIKKDQKSANFDEPKVELKINWSDLKNKKSSTDALKFNFLTIYHRAEEHVEQGKTDENSFDKQKSKYENLFKEDSDIGTGSFSFWNSTKDKVPPHSMAASWYSLEMWYDEATKEIKFHTKIRAVSILNDVADWKDTTAENATAHKVVGAAAKAGFQLSKMEMEYEKTAAAAGAAQS